MRALSGRNPPEWSSEIGIRGHSCFNRRQMLLVGGIPSRFYERLMQYWRLTTQRKFGTHIHQGPTFLTHRLFLTMSPNGPQMMMSFPIATMAKSRHMECLRWSG